MSQRTLNVSYVGRDALLRDWELGAATAMVFAYRVFDTENGMGSRVNRCVSTLRRKSTQSSRGR